MRNRLIFVIGGIAALAVLLFVLGKNQNQRLTSSPTDSVSDKKDKSQISEKSPGSGSGSSIIYGSNKGTGGESGVAVEKSAIPQCFLVHYKHKELAAHSDGEACLHHDNAFKLTQEKINPKSVCVRVNGTPVAFKVKSSEVRVAAVAGPQSDVSISYCTGALKCKESCKIPKDEFMDGLTAGVDENSAGGGGSWGAEDKGEKAALEKEVKEFRGIASDLDAGGARELFKEWIVTESAVSSCSK